MLTPEDFDRHQRKKVTEKMEKDPVAAAKAQIVACLIDVDFFPDNKQALCSKCGVTVFLRPWLLELAEKYHIPIVCPNCPCPIDVMLQIAEDLSEIQAEKPKGDYVV
jgi:hypothetical protein